MMEQAKRLLEQVLKLPVSERASLVVDVLASMDGEPEPDVQAAWVEEAEQRLKRYLAGQDQPGNWVELKAKLRTELGD